MKNNTNGNSKNNSPFQNEEIEFPVTFELKAVMVESGDDTANKIKLEQVYKEQNVEYKYVSEKMSSKGSYISYTYSVTLISKEQLEKTYGALKNVEGLKFAV